MSEYTPTMAGVRGAYIMATRHGVPATTVREAAAEFDRWLYEALRVAKAAAYESALLSAEAFLEDTGLMDGPLPLENPYVRDRVERNEHR